MRRALAVTLIVVCGMGSAHADNLDYGFLGPAPERNFQPIQLIFLNMPFERAQTIGAHHLHFDIETAESNEIAVETGSINALLKFESNRTVLGVRYGFLPDWEAAMHMPFISRYGGFLDPIIDEVEYVFNAGNPQRDFYRNNTFKDFYVKRGDMVLFEDRKETFYPGDLWFTLKRELSLGAHLPILAARASIKAPTGSLDKITGSGKPDFGLGLLADYQLLSPLMLYLNFSFVYPLGPITAGHLTLNPIFTEQFGAELALTREVSVLVQQAKYTSPMHGNDALVLDLGPVELATGVNWVICNNVALQLLAIQNLNNVKATADFTLLLGMKVGFARPPAALAPLPDYPEP